MLVVGSIQIILEAQLFLADVNFCYKNDIDDDSDAVEAELHQAQARVASDQEEIVRLTSELQRLKYQTENYATMFAENDGLTHRLSMAEVREECGGLMLQCQQAPSWMRHKYH